jgi:hypothetical protein
LLFAIGQKYPLSFEKIAQYFVRENGRQQQQKRTELPSSWQALPKLPMRQFGIIALHYYRYYSR